MPPTAVSVDSESVNALEQGDEPRYDAGEKIKRRKRTLAVDTLGLITAVAITGAAVQDSDATQGMITDMVRWLGRLQVIWADGGGLGDLVLWVKQLRPFGRLRLEVVRPCDQVKALKAFASGWIVE